MSDLQHLMNALEQVNRVTENMTKLLEILQVCGHVMQQLSFRLNDLETRMDRQELGFDPPTDWEPT